MTANQINYARLQQEKWRDSETKRANLERERQGRDTIAVQQHQAESARRQSTASLWQASTAEKDLTNKRMQAEAASTSALARMIDAQTGQARAAEEARHNVATEVNSRIQSTLDRSERARATNVNAQINQQQADTASRRADIDQLRVGIEQQRADSQSSLNESQKLLNYSKMAESIMNTVGGILNVLP